jgi:hypothetical protein
MRGLKMTVKQTPLGRDFQEELDIILFAILEPETGRRRARSCGLGVFWEGVWKKRTFGLEFVDSAPKIAL